MESPLCFLAFFSIIMIATTIDARPNPTEYMQDSFVRQATSIAPLPMKKSHFHKLAKATNHRKSSHEEFEQRPNISVYDDNEVSLDANSRDFEPRPNISIYDDSISLKGKKTSDEEFEPRPNISIYDNEMGLKGKMTFDEEFEPRPNISIYDNEMGLKGKKTFDEEFEPRPNISVYEG